MSEHLYLHGLLPPRVFTDGPYGEPCQVGGCGVTFRTRKNEDEDEAMWLCPFHEGELTR